MIGQYLQNCLKEVSVDCVIFGFDNETLKVLLLKWKHIDYWSLPGGKIEMQEDLNDAAERILEQRVGLKGVFLNQFNVFGEIDRFTHYDKKETIRLLEKSIGEDLSKIHPDNRVLSVGYYALLDINKVRAIPDEYTDECQWMDLKKIPHLLFDHNHMVELAIKTLRREIKHQPIFNLLPEKFTLSEIQQLYESILDKTFDRRNFHKQITKQDFLVKLGEKRIGQANKAPNLYRFDQSKYDKALEAGMVF